MCKLPFPHRKLWKQKKNPEKSTLLKLRLIAAGCGYSCYKRQIASHFQALLFWSQQVSFDFLPNILKTRELYFLWQIHSNCENILSLNTSRFSLPQSDLNHWNIDPFMQAVEYNSCFMIFSGSFGTVKNLRQISVDSHVQSPTQHLPVTYGSWGAEVSCTAGLEAWLPA